jgi:hypothetical protein
MGSFISRQIIKNDINGPTTVSIANAGSWYSPVFNLTSEDSIWGMFVTLGFTAAANATVTVEGSTEGDANGVWGDLNYFGGAWVSDGLTLTSGTTKGVISIFPATGQSLPPFLRIKITAGAGAVTVSKMLASRRNLA